MRIYEMRRGNPHLVLSSFNRGIDQYAAPHATVPHCEAGTRAGTTWVLWQHLPDGRLSRAWASVSGLTLLATGRKETLGTPTDNSLSM